MPTTALLIRHAAHDRPGPILVGRDDGIGLSKEGRRQARRLADLVARLPLAAVMTSPSRRCRATAELVAGPHGLTLRVEPDLDEIDFGEWRGRAFTDLDGDPRWHLFNTARGSARVPGGETVAAVQARGRSGAAAALRSTPGPGGGAGQPWRRDPHAVYRVLGLPVDLMLGFEVAPASISTVELGPGASGLLALNWRPGRPCGLAG